MDVQPGWPRGWVGAKARDVLSCRLLGGGLPDIWLSGYCREGQSLLLVIKREFRPKRHDLNRFELAI